MYEILIKNETVEPKEHCVTSANFGRGKTNIKVYQTDVWNGYSAVLHLLKLCLF